MPLRRDSSYPNQAPGSYEFDDDLAGQSRRPAVRLSFRGGLVPKTRWGKIAVAAGFLLAAGTAIAGLLFVRSYLLHDDHFLVPSADSIQISGRSHLTRAQLLSIFGADVDRSAFNIPLELRRAQLESLPWVAHATVMRLLPNRVRVAIVERTPVAFVRQGSKIGLVDANGAIFDLPTPSMEEAGGPTMGDAAQYSFPVLTGISSANPPSTRAARMKIYMDFMAALDAGGEALSHRLSEVDVSNPEDVKAIIPDAAAPVADILVHFGDGKFLERYKQYEQHLAEWRAQYPRLAAVDMRYEQQVVLEMQKDAPAAAPAASSAKSQAANPPLSKAKPAAALHPKAGAQTKGAQR
jgi:cell division protein FtsQ